MAAHRHHKVFTGLTMASSLAWMSILPATAVFAQSTPTVTPGSVTLSGPITPPNGTATFTASASDPNGTAEYQFWVESPNGAWSDMQNYSTNNTFTLSTPSAGDYLVAVEVMDQAQVAAGDWSMAQTTLPDGVFNGSSLSVKSNASGEVAKGQTVTLTATATNVFSPLYQFWYQEPNGTWVQSGDYQASHTFTFTASQSGTYKYVAYVKSPLAANNPHGALASNVGTQVAYGTASQVVVTPMTQTVVADNTAQGQVTYTVEDSHGDRVANFSGTLTLSDNGKGLGISTGGMTSGDVYAVTSGVAMAAFSVPTGDAGQTISVFADNLTTAVTGSGGVPGQSEVANINYSNATAMVTAATASASALMVMATPTGLPNNTANSATVDVSLADQAGNPYVSANNTYFADLTISGSGSFSASGAQISEVVVLQAGVSTASAMVYTQPGASGSVTLNAMPISGDPLSPAAPVSISLYEVSPANHLAISSSMGVASGLIYTTYTVVVEDAQGHVITTGAGSGVNGGTLHLNADSSNLVFYAGAAPTGTAYYSGAHQFPVVPIAQGTGVFTVENDFYQSTPVPITITDTSTLGLPSALVPYTFTLGLPGYAMAVPGFVVPAVNGLPGQREVIKAQLTDVNSDPIAEANQPIWFTVSDHGGVLALPNGASAVGDTYEAFTNASGVATITASLASSAPLNTDASVVVSGMFGGVSGLAESSDYYAVSASNYTTRLITTFAGGRVGGGSAITGQVVGLNALGSPVGANPGDTIVVTSSNSGVLSMPSFQLNAAGTGTATVTAESTGTATLTFTDASNPSATPAIVTYTVVPGAPLKNAQLYYHGQVVAYPNTVAVTSGQVVELWVKNVDGGGNPIPVVGQTPLQVVLPAVANGAWATASGGVTSSIAVANIPPGQSSAPVWFYNAGGAATTATLDRSVAMDAAQQIEFFPTSPLFPPGAVSQEYVTGYTLYGRLVSSGDPMWLSFASGTTSGATAASGVALGLTPTPVAAGIEGELAVSVTVPSGAASGDTMVLTAQDAPAQATTTASVTIGVDPIAP